MYWSWVVLDLQEVAPSRVEPTDEPPIIIVTGVRKVVAGWQD